MSSVFNAFLPFSVVALFALGGGLGTANLLW